MTDKTAVEAMARELSGHFGPLFEELPKDKKALRAWRREGFHVSDNTQADLIGAAQAALAAYHEWLKANGFAVAPVEPSAKQVDAMTKAMRDNGLFNDNYRVARCIYRAMIAAAQGGQ